MTPVEAVNAAALMLGSQAEMARRLRVKPPTVNQWCSGLRPVPAARAVQIEEMTDGEIAKADLCPSFPWLETARSSQKKSAA